MKAIPVSMLKEVTADTLIPLAEKGIGFAMLFRDIRDTKTEAGVEVEADVVTNPAVKVGGVLDWLLRRTRSGETCILIFNVPAGMDPSALVQAAHLEMLSIEENEATQ